MNILEKIHSAGIKFLAPLTLEQTYKAIIKEAIRLVGGKGEGSIILDQKGNLERVYATSEVFYKIRTRKEGLRYRVFKNKVSRVYHPKTIQRLKKMYPALSELKTKSIILIPLVNKGQSMGLITINSTKDVYFVREKLDALNLFGSFASLAIRKSQLHEETKEALENRDLFISMAAHELRTPLTTIIGYSQLLAWRLKQRKPIDKKWVDELTHESNRMKTLVNEFLEINRIKTGQLQYNWKECHLSGIVDRSITNLRLTHPNRKIALKNDVKNDLIIGDSEKLIQVINNVLENAIKYSPKKKAISVALVRRSPNLIISIKDQGQGISMKEIPQIFRGFYKGKTSRHEGMGLGLYLAKNIIEEHQGGINIKSKVNKGTEVQIKLPVINE